MSGYQRGLWVFLLAATVTVVVPNLDGRMIKVSGAKDKPTTAHQEKAQSADVALRALLTAQTADWNRGDIDAFMKGYWNSPETTFAGASGISRGWQTVLARY